LRVLPFVVAHVLLRLRRSAETLAPPLQQLAPFVVRLMREMSNEAAIGPFM
jgi:hypothetical protein